MTEALLEVRDLRSGYGDVTVLWDVSLGVRPGDFVAIVGSNGAGKSTLLASVSGMLRPSQGHVLLDGHDMTHSPAEAYVRRGLVHVPQGRRLFPGMTVEENLLLGAYRRGRDGVRQDLERVLETFPPLVPRLHGLAGRLSGGEQQMCAIGRGLMGRPRVLLIDELSLGLAPVAVDALLEAVRRLHADGLTIVVVEQDVQVALEHATVAYVLEAGRVTLQGSGPELLTDPRIRAAYLGV